MAGASQLVIPREETGAVPVDGIGRVLPELVDYMGSRFRSMRT